jgi:hypothetical protein
MDNDLVVILIIAGVILALCAWMWFGLRRDERDRVIPAPLDLRDSRNELVELVGRAREALDVEVDIPGTAGLILALREDSLREFDERHPELAEGMDVPPITSDELICWRRMLAVDLERARKVLQEQGCSAVQPFCAAARRVSDFDQEHPDIAAMFEQG